MNLAKLTLNELQQGWHATPQGLACNYCQAAWPSETSLDQLQNHLDIVHGGNQSQLLHLKSRYNTLTVKQQDLLTAFATGIKDQALAEQLQVAPATVRHQKFTFREKAKQAKFYLAVYETVFNTSTDAPVTNEATTAVDTQNQAQLLTEDETAKILKTYFDFDQDPVRLKRLPQKHAALMTVLTRIVAEVPENIPLSVTAINAYLKPIYFDYHTIRRELIKYQFIQPAMTSNQYFHPAKINNL
ncbi:DUF2087 domain-containing protein [Lactiplantibacillus nangangensis]|uniref:DUF2087 domain-containing protein n=1 Tax=Lactiplantibacillus nangangensis TaxID=2559917 RepID=A0ABW1SJ81_9LACO|nr:DUF2087 domain-containing protein [Lactiplantibacillus nangangensis]